ncbi:MAG: glycosyltransferase family 2 protein, partial [Solirubrobacterales bacterium]|nr:glycosyltransferase family 2 protein [Solirubrobacterales bacterium]
MGRAGPPRRPASIRGLRPGPDRLKTTVYIPNFNGSQHVGRTLRSLAEQTRPADVVVVDNGSEDDSVAIMRRDFPEVKLLELGENIGFGPALNRAVAAHPADAVIVLNNDVECEPRFLEALLAELGEGVDSVAGVLLQEGSPGLIDSAGVIADRTLMGFDYLHGQPAAVALSAADPLGPTGGAALYRRGAFEAVGGFDERIFLYYEDLDLALRLTPGGGCCRLAGEARALHAYSASLGAASGAKYARTGWSRGYMLRRYGVMSHPGLALRALACEGAICAGQLLRDRTAKGIGGRLRGWHDGGGLERRDADGAPLLEISA